MVFFVLDLDGGQNLCQKYRYARDNYKKHDFSLCWQENRRKPEYSCEKIYHRANLTFGKPNFHKTKM